MFDKSTKVSAVMTTDVLTVRPNDTMERAAYIFKTNNIHHIPVVENGKVIGILSSTDYHKLEHHFTLFKQKNSEEINASVMRSLMVKEVMTAPVATIYQDETLEFAVGIFRENLFHALPVTDKEKNLVGIITPYDFMKYVFRAESQAID